MSIMSVLCVDGLMQRIKQDQLLDAAARQFSFYGLKKTTMGDIAKAAGVSRRTLYNLYPNKETVLSATMEYVLQGILNTINSNLENNMTLQEQLTVFCDAYILRNYELMHASANARELYSSLEQVNFDVMLESVKRYTEILKKIFMHHKKAIKALGNTVEQFAELFLWGSNGLQDGAQDMKHLQIMVKRYINFTVKALENAE